MAKRFAQRVTANGAGRKRKPAPPTFDWRKYDPESIGGDKTLAVELTTYKTLLPGLLADEGKYVLIKGDELCGIFNDETEAIKVAVTRFGAEPVLVHRIAEKEPIFPAGSVLF